MHKLDWFEWMIIIGLLAVAIFAGSKFFEGYSGNTNNNAVPFTTSRYTADQVIYVAAASVTYTPYQGTTPKWTAIYQGNGTWMVTLQYVYKTGDVRASQTWTFYETTGRLA